MHLEIAKLNKLRPYARDFPIVKSHKLKAWELKRLLEKKEISSLEDISSIAKGLADWYEEGLKYYPHPKIFSNWVMGEVLRELKEKKIEIENFVLDPKGLADLLKEIDEGIVSGKIAKEIFSEMVNTGKSAKEIIEKKRLVQLSDKGEIEKIAEEVLKENPAQVQKYLSGKEKLFGFFVGEVMKKSQGKANPKLVNEILREKLHK